jgi:DNA-directed RNA polymerase alpha subunit
VKFIVGLNSDGWPTAIPLDRISELRIDPDDKAAALEFRDEPDRSETLEKAMICEHAEFMSALRSLAGGGKETSVAATTTTTKTPIEDCGLSARSRKALWALGVESLEDAQRIAPHEIRNLRNAGETTLYEIKKALGERGLALRGMALHKQGGGA